MSGQIAGWPGRDARHVAEAAGREPQQRPVLLFVRRSRRPSASSPRAAARGSRARRARRGASGVTVTTSAPRPRAPVPRSVRVRGRVGVGGRREHPRRADEEVGVARRRGRPAPNRPSGGRRRSARRRRARARSIAATTGPFTEPTSVTTGAPASSACTTMSTTCPTGTATITTSASRAAASRRRRDLGRSRRAPSRADRPFARRGRSRRPRDRDAASASPIEPPMRPVPTDRDAHRLLLRQVVAERPRAFEVHVVQLGARLLGVEVHHHPDRTAACRARCRARGRRSAGRRRARAPGRGRGELGREIVGRGEDDAHEIVVVDVVAFEHLLHERLGLRRRSRLSCPRRTWSRRGAPALSRAARLPGPRSVGPLGRVEPGERTGCGFVERPHLRGRERPPLPRRERRVARAVRCECAPAGAPGGRRAGTCGGPAVAAFVDDDLDRALVPIARFLHELARCAGRVGPSSSSTPSRSAAQLAGGRDALDLGEVLLLDAVARMREQLRELAVVREHQQTLRCRGRAGRPGTRAARRARGRPPCGGPADRVAVVTWPAGLLSRQCTSVVSTTTGTPSTVT